MSYTDVLTHEVFTFVDTLYSYGMNEVVISPGSRSTPLALACELHPGIHTYVHPDERSAAFFALGISKYLNAPVGLVCTSGTATANYTPAIVEAGLSHIPLVVMTADRPMELRNIGAPQTIDQENMFHNYVKYYKGFNVPDSIEEAVQLVETYVLKASQHFNGLDQGPIHFNLPFKEPLMPDLTRTDLFKKQQNYTHVETSTKVDLNLSGNGLVILGETREDISQAIDTIQSWNIPILIDPLQHTRVHSHAFIQHYDLIFQSLGEYANTLKDRIDFVIRIGNPVTSKTTNQFLKTLNVPQYLFSEYNHLKTFPIPPTDAFVGSILSMVKSINIKSDGTLKRTFKQLNECVRQTINTEINSFTDEGRYVHELLNSIEYSVLFSSSSMPIRDIEKYDTNYALKVMANRGANGIDGVVSSALGVATKTPVTLLIGDIAFYHDMNGLMISKLENIDITIVVMNNNGGGIFSYLPQYAHKAHFERLFGTPLNIDFSYAAQMYGFKYKKINTVEAFKSINFNEGGKQLIEVVTERENNLAAHKTLQKSVKRVIQNVL